jgi:hypothetical protein
VDMHAVMPCRKAWHGMAWFLNSYAYTCCITKHGACIYAYQRTHLYIRMVCKRCIPCQVCIICLCYW